MAESVMQMRNICLCTFLCQRTSEQASGDKMFWDSNKFDFHWKENLLLETDLKMNDGTFTVGGHQSICLCVEVLVRITVNLAATRLYMSVRIFFGDTKISQ